MAIFRRIRCEPKNIQPFTKTWNSPTLLIYFFWLFLVVHLSEYQSLLVRVFLHVLVTERDLLLHVLQVDAGVVEQRVVPGGDQLVPGWPEVGVGGHCVGVDQGREDHQTRVHRPGVDHHDLAEPEEGTRDQGQGLWKTTANRQGPVKVLLGLYIFKHHGQIC